jgi:ubiquinone/menaquinone biosynthesis C-methylase UbiE
MANPAPTAAAFFGGIVDTYDSLIRRAVPRYDEMTAHLVDYLPPGPRNILELGCGTGNLTLVLLRKFPGAQVTFVDAAPQMTSVTTSRINELGTAASTRAITARFEDLGASLGEGEFDLVTSSMSLHHVPDKLPLYKNIRRWLRPGGTFAFADQLRGTTDLTQQRHWALWLAFCREPGHCTEEEIATLEAHAAAHDHYVSLPDHFDMLARAGFSHPDCLWRRGMYSLVSAIAAP